MSFEMVQATDADINETLTYSIVKDSMSTSDSSLKEIQSPFSLDLYTGKLLLKFTATSNMKGFFKFDIAVHDKGKQKKNIKTLENYSPHS